MRKVSLFMPPDSEWKEFILEYLNDVACELLQWETREAFMQIKSFDADIVFVDQSMLDVKCLQKLKSFKITSTQSKFFLLGEGDEPLTDDHFDESFIEPDDLDSFSRRISVAWNQECDIDVLIVDDDVQIRKMISDYFSDRDQPSFTVRTEENGAAGWEAIVNKTPDVMVLDIKMPVMDGRDLYLKMCRDHRHVPTIVFFDAISNEEFSEMCKAGSPAIVEKGDPKISMRLMLALVKKLFYFSASESPRKE